MGPQNNPWIIKYFIQGNLGLFYLTHRMGHHIKLRHCPVLHEYLRSWLWGNTPFIIPNSKGYQLREDIHQNLNQEVIIIGGHATFESWSTTQNNFKYTCLYFYNNIYIHVDITRQIILSRDNTQPLKQLPLLNLSQTLYVLPTDIMSLFVFVLFI